MLSFCVKSLQVSVDLQRIDELSLDRTLWQNFIANICNIAEDKKLQLCPLESKQP